METTKAGVRQPLTLRQNGEENPGTTGD